MQKKLKGSFAIEAAFVVPIVLGIIFAMIYILYYLHDKNVVYANMQKAVISVAEGKKDYKNNSEWQEDMQNNLWIFEVTSGSISKDMLYINSDVGIECDLSIPVISYFLGSKQQIKLEDKYLTIHPEYMVRVKGVPSKK